MVTFGVGDGYLNNGVLGRVYTRYLGAVTEHRDRCEDYLNCCFDCERHDLIWSICNYITGAPSNKAVVGSSRNIVPRPILQPAHSYEAADGSRPSRHGV